MEYIYGALLLHSAGKEINEANLKKIIEATGEKAEDAQIKSLIAALDGVNIEEVIKNASTPVVATATPASSEPKEEKTKEETAAEEEKKEEEAAEGLAGLFG